MSERELVERLGDEADLCRSEGAHDIAALLDEARTALESSLARQGWWKCATCEAHFPPHPDDGPDCTRCSKCVEVEVLRAALSRQPAPTAMRPEQEVREDWEATR